MARQPHGLPRIQPLRLGQRAGRVGQMEVLLEQAEGKQLHEMSYTHQQNDIVENWS